MFSWFVSFALLVNVSWAFNCSITPIYVDIHKRIVHGTDVFQYGSFIGIGTPAQNQSLWPSLRHNETSVAFEKFCEQSDLANCLQSTRGNFDQTLSSTWVDNKDYASSDRVEIGNESFYGQDVLHLYTHYFEDNPAWQTLLPNFTWEVVTNGSISPGIVGIGSSSTILQELYDAGLIAGRTYSLYVGTGMDRAGGVINGSSVYGGYDEGRFTGTVYNYSMRPSDSEYLPVQVKDIIISDPSGQQNISLVDRNELPDGFEAMITTDQYPMSFPYDVTEKYISALSAEPSDSPDGSLTLTNPFNGSMTIVLSDGFTVTLPAQTMYNQSGLSPVAARDKNSTTPFYLSVAWLSQVYLMLDFDTYQFHLAQAVVENKLVSPKTFCPKSVPLPYVAPNTPKFTKEGLIGAVIGGVFGGAFIIILSFCLCVCWTRNRVSKREKEIEEASATGKMTPFEFDFKDQIKKPSKAAMKTPMFWRR